MAPPLNIRCEARLNIVRAFEQIGLGRSLQAKESDWGVAADVWSATSFTELRRNGLAVDRWNMLHPESKPRVPYITECLEKRPAGPVATSLEEWVISQGRTVSTSEITAEFCRPSGYFAICCFAQAAFSAVKANSLG